MLQSKWIRPKTDMGDVCPAFRRLWHSDKKIAKAELLLTALGVYEAYLNGKKISDYVLAPGWTAYKKRLQYQVYDVTDLIQDENKLTVTVGKGWYRSPMPGWINDDQRMRLDSCTTGLFGELRVNYQDGSSDVYPTDGNWECAQSAVRFSEIYDGERYDACFSALDWQSCEEFDGSTDILIPQEGEIIKEMERITAKSVFITPDGETVVDFGQVVTGYAEFTVDAKAGDVIHILHGEVLDANGNFYNENYRSAKSEIIYTCSDGLQTWHPGHTFFGFRYLKLAKFPVKAMPEQFTAIAVYSNMEQTGTLQCANDDLNKLFSNILWGQKGNFLDVPTDCPQRDERLGWTGDAEVFVKTASYNYDVETFFRKWLRDLAADQFESGGVPHVIPDYILDGNSSAAWGDAAVICPWQIYMTYGNSEILKEQFPSMKKWIDYISSATKEPNLWIGGEHFGDWLGLDAPIGSYKGSSREDFIASAFYAYSTNLLIQAGKVIGEDISDYESLYLNIVDAFGKRFPSYHTQTEYTLAVWFKLAENLQKTADELAELIRKDNCKLQTGFVGTPFLLHVLSEYGHTELAYKLLLRKEYPSWLYPVVKGATTIWEHWDGIGEDGSFWSADMNSFNHYAYGAVADWIYEQAAGIKPSLAGFKQIRLAPKPSKQLGWLDVSIKTRQGIVRSKWSYENDGVRYEIETPVPSTIVIDTKEIHVIPGKYVFWGNEL